MDLLGAEPEIVWHRDTDLTGAAGVVLPGGFAHGDYLRTGAIARFSPVMAEVERLATAGRPVLGICNGFQILAEAGSQEELVSATLSFEKLHRWEPIFPWRDWRATRQAGTSALIAEEYKGIRPAPGYPACPDHTEKRKLFDLLDAPSVGMELTDHFAMTPGASVSGLYFAHPDARYFTVGRIDRDQVEDYASRKGMPLDEMERWLGPNLGYDPQG